MDSKGKKLVRIVAFRVGTTGEAKKKVLAILKRAVAHVKDMGSMVLIADAVPMDTKGGVRVGSADETLRPRRRYSNRRLLGIKNPDAILVQGYGPDALRRIAL